MKSIVIANIIEFNARILNDRYTPEERELWRLAGVDICDMALFWCGDNKIVISPLPYDTLWVENVLHWLKWQNVHMLTPQYFTESICNDILADNQLMTALDGLLGQASTHALISWGATTEMYALKERLQDHRDIFAPELPPLTSFWTADYLDSKTGFRELCMQLGQEHYFIRVPRGFTCFTVEQALEVVSHFIRQGRGFVIKAHQGVGGFGVLIYRTDMLQVGIEAIHQDIVHWIEADHEIHTAVFQTGPLIVEEYIDSIPGSSLNHPTYDAVILPDGKIKTIGVGGMLMEDQFYQGVVVGEALFRASREKELILIGETVGTAMAKLGYRGWFDVDFIVDANDKLYLSEINARRTSPSHVFELLESLRARDPAITYALANDHFYLSVDHPLSYKDIHPVFDAFQSHPPTPGCSCLPTIVTSLKRDQPYLGYVVAGPNYSVVCEAKERLESTLRENTLIAH